ncbi:calcium-binding protein [Microvirga lotononidis]|uniref:Ca2+-binding protein, RTX toxin n=1 Tax=Microvirga lotononidis TaxID=864069 RepID=I4YSK3_9HYPH|nr:calcium-binding protein [Microvirga lotononidis]EIM26945.1 Ca2+-binding protein, RTX toxin [Microvirga lotononidis]WQO28862.1 calcium-binding protein [Microvirga lotononidis]
MAVVTPKIWSPMDTTSVIGVDRDSLTMLPNGGYVVTWRENEKIAFQLYDGTGAKVAGKSFVDASSGTAQQFSDVVSYTADGGFAITWTEGVRTQTGRTLRTQKFNFDGSPNGAATSLDAPVQSDGAQMVANGSGWATAYIENVGGTNTVRLSLFDQAGTAGNPISVSGASGVGRPDVTWLGGTKYAVSFLTDTGSSVRIVDGSIVGTGADIAGATESKVAVLKTADGQPSGQFVVVTNAGQLEPIIAQTYTANADGSATLVGSVALSPAQNPALPSAGDKVSVIALRSGGYAVAYVSTASGNPDIWVKVVDANGQQGPAINVSAEAGLQTTPSVFEMADGRLAVSWENPSHPTSGSGIETKIVDARATAVAVVGTSKNDIYAPSDHPGDNFNGGGGIDTLTFQAAGSGVAVDLAAGVGTAGIAAGDTYTSFERVIGSNFADTLAGGNAASTLQGGAGNDVYFVKAGTTIVEGAGGGTDSVYTDATYTLSDHLENLFATGANAIDLIGNSANNLIVGNEAANKLYGMGGNDTLNGGGGNDTLEGGDGDDVLIGGAGADVMIGGAGNDTYYIDDVNDQIIDGSGVDTVYLAVSYDISRLGAIENITGVGAVNITLTGNDGNNVFTGNDGANILYGGKGNDILDSGAGNDRIHGGDGNDVLTGGKGNDIFVFDTKPHKSKNVDRIVDFNVADDSIYLENKYFKVTPSGTLTKPKQMASKHFFKGSKAHDADDRIIYDSKKGILYYDADGTGGAAQIKIATLSPKLKMTHKDFFVI